MLAADPIVRAVEAKRQRLERAITETFDAKDYDAYTKLESVDLKAIEVHARAIQHPGFTSGTTVNVSDNRHVVVMPRPGELPAPAIDAEVIDVKAVE